MNRPDIYEAVSSYLDNELAEAERAQIADLIQTDESYATVYRELQALSDSLHDLPDIPLPEDFHQEVMERVQKEHRLESVAKKRSLPKRYRTYLATAAVFAIVIISSYSMRNLYDMQKGSKVDESGMLPNMTEQSPPFQSRIVLSDDASPDVPEDSLEGHISQEAYDAGTQAKESESRPESIRLDVDISIPAHEEADNLEDALTREFYEYETDQSHERNSLQDGILLDGALDRDQAETGELSETVQPPMLYSSSAQMDLAVYPMTIYGADTSGLQRSAEEIAQNNQGYTEVLSLNDMDMVINLFVPAEYLQQAIEDCRSLPGQEDETNPVTAMINIIQIEE